MITPKSIFEGLGTTLGKQYSRKSAFEVALTDMAKTNPVLEFANSQGWKEIERA